MTDPSRKYTVCVYIVEEASLSSFQEHVFIEQSLISEVQFVLK